MTTRTALPSFTDARTTHTIAVGDIDVVFNIVPIPGKTYNQILDDHRDDDGKVANEAIAVDIITHGIDSVYTSVESTPQPWERDDAVEVWETWPDWARGELFTVVHAYSVAGPRADPFSKRKRNGNDDN